MKTMCALLVGAFALAVGRPAVAEIVEVTTSVSMPTPPSQDELRQLLHAVARDIIANIDSFQPVVVALTGAHLAAGRLYLRFLLADEEGARLLGMVRRPEALDRGAERATDGHGLISAVGPG